MLKCRNIPPPPPQSTERCSGVRHSLGTWVNHARKSVRFAFLAVLVLYVLVAFCSANSTFFLTFQPISEPHTTCYTCSKQYPLLFAPHCTTPTVPGNMVPGICYCLLSDCNSVLIQHMVSSTWIRTNPRNKATGVNFARGGASACTYGIDLKLSKLFVQQLNKREKYRTTGTYSY